MNDRVSSFDVMKCIAAFFVVYIHIPFSGRIGNMLVPIARVAVPFFLMVSGYFIWNADSEIMRGKIKKQAKDILFLTIFGSLLFFIWGIIKSYVFDGSAIAYFNGIFSVETLVKFLVFNVSPFSAHLWYLSSYLYVLVICYFLCKYNLLKIGFSAIPFLLICDLVLGKYSMVLFGREFPNELAMNFLFTGMPYFLLGCLLRKKAARLKTLWHKDVFILGFIVFSALAILEKAILMHNQVNALRDHYISTTPAVLCAFLYAMQNPQLLQGTLAEKIGREGSLLIYLIHPVFITILSVIVKIPGANKIYGSVAPLLAFVVSAGFAMAWNSVLKPMLFKKRAA